MKDDPQALHLLGQEVVLGLGTVGTLMEHVSAVDSLGIGHQNVPRRETTSHPI